MKSEDVSLRVEEVFAHYRAMISRQVVKNNRQRHQIRRLVLFARVLITQRKYLATLTCALGFYGLITLIGNLTMLLRG